MYEKLQSSVPSVATAAEAEARPTTSLKSATRGKIHANTVSDAKSESQKFKDIMQSESAKNVRDPTSNEVSGGRPTQLSRTQKDKDRKKRSKAKILMEHVDLIKDGFWEERPWILSGKTG